MLVCKVVEVWQDFLSEINGDKWRYLSKIVIFFIPLAFDAPVKEVPVGILQSRLVWKNYPMVKTL